MNSTVIPIKAKEEAPLKAKAEAPLTTKFKLYVPGVKEEDRQSVANQWKHSMSRLLTGDSLYCAQTSGGPMSVIMLVYIKHTANLAHKKDFNGHVVVNLASAEEYFFARLKEFEQINMIVIVRLVTSNIRILPTPTCISVGKKVTEELLLEKQKQGTAKISPWHFVLNDQLKDFSDQLFQAQKSKPNDARKLIACFRITEREKLCGTEEITFFYTFPVLLEEKLEEEKKLYTISEKSMELLIRRYFNSLDVEEGVDVSLLVSYANNTFTVTTYKNVEGFKEPKADAFDLKMTNNIYAYVPKDRKVAHRRSVSGRRSTSRSHKTPTD